MNEEDEAAINKFLITAPKKERTLYDIIQEKIAEKKAAFEEQFEEPKDPHDIQVLFRSLIYVFIDSGFESGCCFVIQRSWRNYGNV